MQWPSQRVSQQGLFHPAKANYDYDTKNFLQLLLEESKMSTALRQKDYFLRRDDVTHLPKRFPSEVKFGLRSEPPICIRPSSSRRRSQDNIVSSGAYVRDKFVPDRSNKDRDALKRRLQDIMANDRKGVNSRIDVPKIASNVERKMEKNRFEELVDEIQERQDWLNEMELLGEGHKYRDLINSQIQNKIKEMEQLKSESAKD